MAKGIQLNFIIRQTVTVVICRPITLICISLELRGERDQADCYQARLAWAQD